MLAVKDLSKSFNGVKALDNLRFEVTEDIITALIGPNGAGKTTFFNIITGFLEPNQGEVYFNGKPIANLPPHKVARMGIGRTFQNIRLCPTMNVLENVMLALKYKTGDKLFPAILRTPTMLREDKELRELALTYLEMVDMANKRDSSGANLSHGQKRLVEIARALALKPKLLLLDEPMSGLFPGMIEKVLELMRQLSEKGTTILFIEHNIKVVMKISDWIVVLNQGRNIAEGPPDEIRNNAEVITAYLGKGATNASRS